MLPGWQRSDGTPAKLDSPSTARNRGPILEVLKGVVPRDGWVLETSAGSGQHSVYFAEAFPRLTWQPTDIDDRSLRSIEAWAQEAQLPNLLAPERLDVTETDWSSAAPDGADLVLSINMIHISPWEASQGLFAGAGRVLKPGGLLITYGPYLMDGEFTAPSNARFEQWLKSRDPRFGQRDLAALQNLGERHGLHREQLVPMPANNFTVVYRKQ